MMACWKSLLLFLSSTAMAVATAKDDMHNKWDHLVMWSSVFFLFSMTLVFSCGVYVGVNYQTFTRTRRLTRTIPASSTLLLEHENSNVSGGLSDLRDDAEDVVLTGDGEIDGSGLERVDI
mmetsp:Transcript_111769/g.204719  ORF Transcript_111769/g.204719 Transcript_111769/m.204719 type:complete len:120 (-) Transcript_111769:43-402(-)